MMPMFESWRDPTLINTVGHSAGVLLFCVIIVFLLRDWRSRGLRRTALSLLAAGLALGWNIGSLIVLAVPDQDSELIKFVVTASFSMLTVLPAVLLQVALQDRQPAIVVAGYAVSGLATVFHFTEFLSSSNSLHQTALLVVVVGFGVLAVFSFLSGCRDAAKITYRSQCISLICLLLFTSSFLHFGYEHTTTSPWSAEITWHHIGIPVALIVLLRDYRFLLLDTFLRFAVNFGLAAVYVAGVVGLSLKMNLPAVVPPSMFLTGISLIAICLSLVLFAYLRNALEAWMNRAIFHRQSIEGTMKVIRGLTVAAHSEQELLLRSTEAVANYLRTDHAAITKAAVEPDSSGNSILFARPTDAELNEQRFYAEARIRLRLSSGDTRYLIVGSRRGGQRYGSDDLNDMQQLGAAIVEQLERFRAEELKRLVSEAELRALQAQINPHFLFNALNTLYGTIDRGSHDARRIVLNLAEIFRYFLQGHRTVIPLSEELRIVEAYLDIEALRLGNRLKTELLINESARATLIPILSIQPLVENAVKHGVAPKQEECRVCVRAETMADGVRITVEDTGEGFERSQKRAHRGNGIGLENVRRRLALAYGPGADLTVHSSAEVTSVSFFIPNSASPETSPTKSALYV